MSELNRRSRNRLAFRVVGAGHAQHLDPDRARRDLERVAVLTRQGWTILRFDAYTVLREQARLAAVVRAELLRRGVVIAG